MKLYAAIVAFDRFSRKALWDKIRAIHKVKMCTNYNFAGTSTNYEKYKGI